jgi:hypothetical protein
LLALTGALAAVGSAMIRRAPRPVPTAAARAEVASRPPTAEEVAARDRRHFQALERRLAAEPVDPAWAPATERIIARTLRQPVFKGSTLLGAACRSTLCRFEVRHRSEADRRRFGGALTTRLPSLPSGSMQRAEGSDPTSIVYAAREGHPIPRQQAQ